MPFSLKVHHHERVPGTTQVRLKAVTPYVRLCRGDGPPVFVQGGQLWTESGDAVLTPPDWYAEEVARLSPETRREVGLDGPASAAPVVSPVETPIRQWQCPEAACGAILTMRQKGFHIAHHRRRLIPVAKRG